MQTARSVALFTYFKAAVFYAGLIGAGIATLYLMHNGWPL
jgi:TM2 domain-containing membrane protein YozV